MPRKEGQKLKLLTLLEIFVRETDEKHPISVPRMVELLKERGIVAERKSVYDDIQTLNEMPDTPFEIVQQRGRGGGYRLARCPEEYAVGDILRVAEGSIAPVSCVKSGESECPNADNCLTLPLWKELDRVMNDYLESVTLADLINGNIAAKSTDSGE